MDATATPGAVCATHPEQALTFTCARCGNFGCEQCRSGPNRELCPACAARIAAPVSVMSAVGSGLGSAARAAPGLAPVLVFHALGKFAIDFFAEPLQASSGTGFKGLSGRELVARFATQMVWILAASCATSLLDAAVDGVKILRIADALGGQRRSLGTLVAATGRRYAVIAAVLVSSGLAISLGFVACCVPAVLLSALFTFTEQEVMLSGSGFLDAFKRSIALTRGRYMKLVALMVADLGAVLLVRQVVSGAVKTFALEGSTAALVRHGAVAPVTVAISFAMDGILTVLYLRLRDPEVMAARARV